MYLDINVFESKKKKKKINNKDVDFFQVLEYLMYCSLCTYIEF